jgi:hypothetical protein
LQVGNAVRVSQEYTLPIVPTLGDVMGQTGDDNAGGQEIGDCGAVEKVLTPF